MHYYQFNIGDYQSHTAHLDDLEDLAYRRLLDWVYLHEKPLPLDIQEIAKYIRMRTECERIANVLREFFVEGKDGYSHARVSKEIKTYKTKSKKASESATARWDRQRKASKGDANALRTHCEGNAKQEPITNNHKPITSTKRYMSDKSDEPYEIFDYWVRTMNKTGKTAFSQDRKKPVIARLKEGYTVDEIKRAIFNCSQSEYHMSGNYNDLTLICRNPSKLENFRDMRQKNEVLKNGSVLEDFMNE